VDAGSPKDGDAIVVDVAALEQTPHRLCASRQTTDDAEPRVWATAERGEKWVIVTRREQGEAENGQTWRHYFPLEQIPDALVELGCGRLRLHASRPLRADASRAEGTASRPSPSRVWVEVLSRVSEVGATPVTLVDFHEDWDGGSGGTVVQGQIDGHTLRLTEAAVSPGSNSNVAHWTTITEFDLRGLTREVVETKVATIVVSTVPPSVDSGS
jgi:hypothetical protein